MKFSLTSLLIVGLLQTAAGAKRKGRKAAPAPKKPAPKSAPKAAAAKCSNTCFFPTGRDDCCPGNVCIWTPGGDRCEKKGFCIKKGGACKFHRNLADACCKGTKCVVKGNGNKGNGKCA